MPKLKFYYVTKWAFTKGILKFCEDQVCISYVGGKGYLIAAAQSKYTALRVGKKDWFESLWAAEERVRQLVGERLKSIDKQRVKLHKMQQFGGIEVNDA